MPLPSEIQYSALLQYSPRGQSDTAAESRRVTRAIKIDSFCNHIRIIPFAAKRIGEVIGDYPALQQSLGAGVTLVPVPRSAPLVKGGLWPSHRIAEEILKAGLASKLDPCLERTRMVTKSSTARSNDRPKADDHYQTLRVNHEPVLMSGGRICVVDDVVTRGATLLASVARVQEIFPAAEVTAFALVRTVSDGDIKTLLQPVAGTIELRHEGTHREP